MAKSVISEQEVIEACERLAARGEEPTTLNVYDELGRKGSYGTIQKHMAAWKGAKPSATSSASAAPMPSEVDKLARDFAAQMFAKGKAAADADHATERAGAAAQIAKLEKEKADLMTRLLEKDRDYEELLALHEMGMKEIDMLQDQLRNAQNVEQRLATLEAHVTGKKPSVAPAGKTASKAAPASKGAKTKTAKGQQQSDLLPPEDSAPPAAE